MRKITLKLMLAAWICMMSGQAMALELKISHVLPTNETVHEILLQMAESLKEKSNGYFVMPVYANGELGNNKDNIDQCRRGANILVIADCGFLADYVPAYGAMNGPFLYQSRHEIVALGKSDWHKKQMDEVSARGIKVLAMDWFFGPRHVISGKVITTPSDMERMKVRVPPNKVWIDTITAMGGSPTVLQWPEVYSALSQGVVDAAEAPLSTIFGSKLFEAKKNISSTRHFMAMTGMITSQKVYDSIPPDMQKLLHEEIAYWGDKCSELTEQREAEWKKRLEEVGVSFNEVDNAAFVEACKIVYDNPEWPSFEELRRNIEANM
ncbi:MAG: C4-dicarboxylate TRAP transporter substrate-binding protein [Planctomycetes bacterium]|nr:C4-dicarboxylate TRAP transporter substrate-binding protein [Planctomycetota bacterium]